MELNQIGYLKNGERIKVILVDDEFVHRRILGQILRNTGFDVVGEGVNGEEALKFCSLYEPDIIFLDVHMPRLNGLDITKILKDRYPNIRIVMCTSDKTRTMVLNLAQYGIKDYIIKPFEKEVIYHKLRKINLEFESNNS